jgi:AcrR family transcriptional regulator
MTGAAKQRRAPQKRKTPQTETSQAILTAARKVFLEHGYGAATTDMLQAAAGVSKSTLYIHFPTKEILFKAVCRMKSEDFTATLNAAVGTERRPREYLMRFGIGFLTSLLSRESLAFYRLMVAAMLHFPRMGRTYHSAGIQASSDIIAAYLREAHAAGWLQVPHPVMSGELFLGMLRGEMYTRVILTVEKPPEAVALQRHVAYVVDHFLAAHAAAA